MFLTPLVIGLHAPRACAPSRHSRRRSARRRGARPPSFLTFLLVLDSRAPARLRRAVACWAWRAGRARCSRSAWPPASSPAARCSPPTRGSGRGGRRCGWRSRSSRASSGRRAAASGRRLPEDDEAFAVVEGVLRADASLDRRRRLAQRRCGRGRAERQGAERTGRHGAPQRRSGRLAASLLTVVGSLAAERIDDWRAGRRVRLPVAASPAVALSRSRRARSASARWRGAARRWSARSRAARWSRCSRAAAGSTRRWRARARLCPPRDRRRASAAGARSRRRSSPRSSSAIAPGSTTTCSGGCRRRAPTT